MLKEARDDLNRQTRQHEEEMQLLNEQLQNKRDLDFMRFKEFVEKGGNPALFHGAPSSSEVGFVHFQIFSTCFRNFLFQLARLRQLEDDSIAQNNTIAHLSEQVRQAREEAAKWKARLQQKTQQSNVERERQEEIINKLNNDLAREVQLNDQQPKAGQTNHEHSKSPKTTKPTLMQSGLVAELRAQLEEKEARQQDLVRALADIRAQMVKIAEGNLTAMNNDERQNLSIQALIATKTGQLQDKIDDYETQLRTLKQELKAQKDRNQQYIDEANDARERLAQNEKKLGKLQQQNTTLTNDAQRRLTGQQLQLGQVRPI